MFRRTPGSQIGSKDYSNLLSHGDTDLTRQIRIYDKKEENSHIFSITLLALVAQPKAK
jgi:hypothetical protein